MGFDDIAARFKKKQADEAEAQQAQQADIDVHEMYAIRARMLGVLIRDAREVSGYTQEELGDKLSVSDDTIRAWEFGESVPSLPQIELLAYILEVPISHFWGAETFSKRRDERAIDSQEYAIVRDRMIGVLTATARQGKNMSQEELAEKLEISVNQLQDYESGQDKIPMTIIVSLSSILGVSMSYFLEGSGKVGQFLALIESSETFAQLPDDIREFISKPANQAYIRVAMVLADVPTDNLRSLAEGLIDITM